MQVPDYIIDRQRTAADPLISAWVSANAGSGKTYVLARRVIRLMLEGSPPSRILCLTFTKAAAAEMSNRVFKLLATWTMLDDKALGSEIEGITGSPVSPHKMRRARQLFALALDTPGGLKIQTIHAFCQALLHQFPLEANVSGHFDIVDEFTQAAMLAEARRAVLLSAGNSSQDSLARAYETAMAFGTDTAMEDALDELISNRDSFTRWMINGVSEAMAPMYSQCGFTHETSLREVQAQALAEVPFSDDFWRGVGALAGSVENESNKKVARCIEEFLASDDPAIRLALLEEILLTKDGNKQKAVVTKKALDLRPDIAEELTHAQEAFCVALEHVRMWHMLQASAAIFEIALAVLNRYKMLKRARSLVDYEDMISEAANLLHRSEIHQWVQYKLDRGIDHVLIDEAQDTSPRQWEIINAIVGDFFAGDTATTAKRTVFAVGDEKQSIFSFQGAEPLEFDRQKQGFLERIEGARESFESVKLDMSFRSTKAIIEAVDEVFAIAENARGLSKSETLTRHASIRHRDPGQVQVWPIFRNESAEKTNEWLAGSNGNAGLDPAEQLANRMADEIEKWVGRPLKGTGEPLKYGDILILVRKRDRFIGILTRVLKDRGLAIAGVDRLKLTDHVAVEDLLALGRFTLMPKDDLALAGLLKSPLFNVSEDQLFVIANGRKARSLHAQLRFLASQEDHPLHGLIVDILSTLEQFIRLSGSLPVYEFYANILSAGGGRKAFLKRLGSEVEEILDAFMEAALAHDQTEKRGLEDFISSLRSASPIVKREIDMTRNEIRILTAHSAKGLEAPVVFLIDSCSSAYSRKLGSKVLDVGSSFDSSGYLWQPRADKATAATRLAISEEENKVQEEYRRLLYVAMTRAADRLIVCGYASQPEKSYQYWHSMVHSALKDKAIEFEFAPDMEPGLLWTGSIGDAEFLPGPDVKKDDQVSSIHLPEWLLHKPRFEPPPPKPLTPSGAFLALDELEAESVSGKTMRLSDEALALAAQKGVACHKLLQYLPTCAKDDWPGLAENYLRRTAAEMPDADREHVLKSVLNLLNAREFEDLFVAGARSEVSIAGYIDLKTGRTPVSGQIDRLVVNKDRVSIIDYKSGSYVPADPAATNPTYIAQLALYRLIVSDIYPDKPIECYLLWTEGPKMMHLPAEMLDQAIVSIKNG